MSFMVWMVLLSIVFMYPQIVASRAAGKWPGLVLPGVYIVLSLIAASLTMTGLTAASAIVGDSPVTQLVINLETEEGEGYAVFQIVGGMATAHVVLRGEDNLTTTQTMTSLGLSEAEPDISVLAEMFGLDAEMFAGELIVQSVGPEALDTARRSLPWMVFLLINVPTVTYLGIYFFVRSRRPKAAGLDLGAERLDDEDIQRSDT
ncbi:MAG: hypothetical protein FWD98_07455 [Defluviitaleaceae bacterium]|nr:hypothetical protein [Defluviitaleaceae bacterium]